MLVRHNVVLLDTTQLLLMKLTITTYEMREGLSVYYTVLTGDAVTKFVITRCFGT